VSLLLGEDVAYAKDAAEEGNAMPCTLSMVLLPALAAPKASILYGSSLVDAVRHAAGRPAPGPSPRGAAPPLRNRAWLSTHGPRASTTRPRDLSAA
jgi:hypothetical protein